jgi:hypothetical protein
MDTTLGDDEDNNKRVWRRGRPLQGCEMHSHNPCMLSKILGDAGLGFRGFRVLGFKILGFRV